VTLVRDALWTIVASLCARAIGLVGTLVAARFLSPAEYGETMVGIDTLERPAMRLLIEVVAGAVGVGVGAFLFARDRTQDLLARVLDAVRSRA
jgi:hypothetical protein